MKQIVKPEKKEKKEKLKTTVTWSRDLTSFSLSYFSLSLVAV